MKTIVLLLALAVSGWAELAPDSVVEGLYRADLQHYGRPARWARPVYRIVPYRDTYFASTSHGARQAPDTTAFWERVGGRWSFIFEVVTGPGDPPEAFQEAYRALFARYGFSFAMEQKLLSCQWHHAFPADMRQYSRPKKALYRRLRRALVAGHPDLEDRSVVAHLDGEVALLQFEVRYQQVREVWRYQDGAWKVWASVPDPLGPGSEERWVQAGITPGLRSKLVLRPSDELPY